MTVIWLSPGIPANRAQVAEGLGPDFDVPDAPHQPPEGSHLAVVTIFERELLTRLAQQQSCPMVILKPPGSATPTDLPPAAAWLPVREAATVADLVETIRSTVASPVDLPFVPAAEPVAARPVTAEPAGSGRRRSNWVASVAIAAVAALAAVLVLATKGGGAAATAGPGAAPGAGGAQAEGLPPAGLGGPGSGASDDSGDRANMRQQFEACLKSNGVDVGSTTGGRPNLDLSDPTVAAALEKCRATLPRPEGSSGSDRGMGPGGPAAPGGPGVPLGPGGLPPAPPV